MKKLKLNTAIAAVAWVGLGALQTASAGEINVIMEEVPDYDIVVKLTEQFTAQNPGITVTFDAMPFDAMRDKIMTSSFAPSATYDVIIIDNPWTEEFARGGFLEPLDARIAGQDGYAYDDFVGALADISKIDGAIYGVPYYNYALGLIVRQDIFDANGLEIPATIEDYMSVVAGLTSDGMYGAAMQPQKGYKIMEEWKNWLYANGGELFDADGNVIINNEAAVNALNQYIATFNQSAPPNSANWGFDEALRAVSSGNAATMLSYNWMLPALNKEGGMSGDLAGNFTLHEVPGGKSVLGLWSWGITANSENKDDAWSFISWITSPEVAIERAIMGGAPVRTSVLNNPEVWEKGYGEAYYSALSGILEDAAPLSSGNNAEELIEIVGTELSAAVTGQKSVQDALDAAANGVERANR
jgi:ABC-type glycerol-3-phosphate transport system substrate-binding protein